LPNRFLTKRLVLGIHRDQIEHFGGRPGIRDQTLLDSALEQPRATFGGTLLHPTVHEQAAAYLFHLVNNHPFVDGNKRVSFAAMDVFLRLNGLRLELSNEAAYDLVIGAAKSELDKEAISEIIRANTSSTADR
jgi:death on curing protein